VRGGSKNLSSVVFDDDPISNENKVSFIVDPAYTCRMLFLGIESSCDETGVALVQAQASGVPRLLGAALHSQVAMHRDYGGVVPELASRDHIRRVLPLTEAALAQAAVPLQAIDAVAYTRGPGLAGALLVGAGVAAAMAMALGVPALPVHHLEGHLLSPFLSADPPEFPFVALCEHTNFVSREHYNGDHLVYCGEYVQPDHAYLHMPEDALADLFMSALKTFNARFTPEWVRKRWVFRTPYAQPIPFVNHSQNIPPLQTPLKGVFMANMSQVYPWDRGTNYAVQLGREVAALVQQSLTASDADAPPSSDL